jgi:hypothetical protein
MSPKTVRTDKRAASPVAAAMLIAVAVVAVVASLLLAAAPAAALDVDSASMSADKAAYQVAPGEYVTIKITGMPDANGLASVSFEDADGFSADEFFTVTAVEDAELLTATIKIVADAEAPLGEYTVEIAPVTNATTDTVLVTLTVERSLAQVISGNVLYIGTGIGLIVLGAFMSAAIRNAKAKKVTKPLSMIMYIGAFAALAWVIYQAVMVML